MSELKQRITTEMKAAMRAKDKERLSTIRMMLAELKRIEIDERIELDDTRVITVLDKMSKQRRDSISQFEEAARMDLASAERRELEVIKTFLPQPLTDEELVAIVKQATEESGAQSMQDMGKVMGLVKPQVQGRADMGNISKLVKAVLTS
ncbi:MULTISPECIES: GatB/YqeY domain-containing protein [unclassified Neptuniibacter]|uniref:GatB/YqeY domain-containing protein n=1 Tax=unclassified Neptuniibacter TaxID=2630693 RepID=UPI000C4A92D6|nr:MULTISPECIES: GatB/YqeY domain-containing protein [unclassified Neptuniibacter]MAY42216.1 glutamyl-tRNA amidotransferase [Oceanospirillaceae bacterium]|tara:strand:- start:6188 stop:6637 length:450 start_codon:yes stop_codon:yes gene_type:complete